MSKKQYSFNFDLNQKLLSKHYDKSISNAYNEIKVWMTKHSIEHRQGSGYNTINKLTEFQLANMITTLNKEKPWIFKCQSVFDYYEIGQRKIAGELIVTDITVDDKKPSHTNMKNNKNQMEM